MPKLNTIPSSNNNILQKEDIVNRSIRGTGGNDTRFSLENTAEADAETAKGHLKYIDKNKSQQWSQSRGLRLPKLADTITDNNNILQKEDIVKSSIREDGENDTRFSLENTAEADADHVSTLVGLLRNSVDSFQHQENIFHVMDSDISRGKNASETISRYFQSIGGKAENPVLGTVELTKSGAKTTVFHGVGREKITAAAAIKDVIEHGRIVNKESNWKGRGYDTYVIAGKGLVNHKPSIVGVVVKAYPNSSFHNKFYLHEIIKIGAASDAATNYSLTYVNEATPITDNTISQDTNAVKSSIREDGVNDTRFSLENTAEADAETDTAYLTEPAERIRNDIEEARLRAEARKGKTYTRDDIRQVCVSILENVDAGAGRGLSMSRKDKAAMMTLASRALNAGKAEAAEPHIRRLAAFAAQKALVQDTSEYFDYKRALAHMRDTVRHAINLTDADKQVLDSMFGEASSGYKALFGGGTRGADAVYDALSEARPDLYPRNVRTEAEKLRKLAETHQWLKEGAEAKSERLLDVLDADDRAAFAELVHRQIDEAMRGGGRPSRLSAELQAAEERRQRELARMRARYEKKISNMREKVRSREMARLAERSIEPLAYVRPENLTAAAEQYGRMKQGEKPARDIAVPKKISSKQYVSRFARTMLEAGVTPETAAGEFEQRILDGAMTFERVTDKAAKQAALSVIRSKGFDGALKHWNTLIEDGKRMTKENMALGMTLYNQCVNAGDVTNAMRIAADLALEATRSGQVVQAARLLKQMGADGQLYSLEKSIQQMNRMFGQQMKKAGKDIALNPALAEAFLKAETEEEREAAYDRLIEDAAGQIPATVKDKWNSWRYLAMLGNPRTHIRNIVGNAVFVPAIQMKNAIGAVLEKTLPARERTKAVKKAAGTAAFAREDYQRLQSVIQGGQGRYEVMGGIEDKRQMFKAKALEAIRKKNFDLLEREDAVFLKRAYTDSLSGIMTARGMTPAFLNSGTLEAQTALEELRNYAILEAQKATYRDANALAAAMNRFQRKAQNSRNPILKGSGLLLEGIAPFKKTPLNILRRGVEYSPLGLMSGTYKILDGIKTGQWSAAEAIDDLAKGLTGTLLVLLGMWLTRMGLLSGEDEKGTKERAFDAMQGEQSYALQFGGHSYTIDWMVPASLPLFVGNEIMKMMEKGEFQFSDAADAMSKIAEPMTELSLLSGLDSVLQTAAYSKSGALTAVISQMVTSYFGQAVPTLGGQFARTIDKTRRTAYVDRNSQLPQELNRFLQRQAMKIPFASFLLQPRVDNWGRVDTYGESAAARAAASFLSPGYYARRDSGAADREIGALFERTGETDVLPRSAQKKFTVDGREIHLTGEQYTDYAVTRGQYALREVNRLISGKREIKTRKTDKTGKLYREATDKERIKAVRQIYDEAQEFAKGEVNRRYGLWEEKK